MELIYGTVKVKGNKENVLAMYDELEDYYDKYLTNQSGSDDNYTIEFEFSSKIGNFFSYRDYFLSYSEEYKCHISAELEIEGLEGEEEPMVLEYDNGEIVHGMSEYGVESDF